MNSNVVGMNEFVGMANGDLHCWLCQKAVSTRALFCHHCGTVQPVRDIDHFARLGVERRFDVDMDALERNYATLSRTLDPSRFLIRGLGERGHAQKQMEALDEAAETLRDPLRRCRYWLAVNGKMEQDAAARNQVVDELKKELDDALAASACDRFAQRAGQAMEQRLITLMQSLRGQNWREAIKTLSEIDGIEAILGDIHSHRSQMATAK